MTYEDLLKQSFDELPVDKLLPGGSWHLRVRNASFLKPKTADDQAKWFVVVQGKEPMDDVDMDAVKEAFPDGDYGVSEIPITFWLRKPSDLTKFINFMSLCGVVVERPFSVEKVNSLLKSLKNTEFLGMVGNRMRQNTDGTSEPENTVTKFAALE